MRQLTRNVFVETEIRGCNHGFVTTSDGIVMIDSPHKPSDALKLEAEIARHGGRLRFRTTRPRLSGNGKRTCRARSIAA